MKVIQGFLESEQLFSLHPMRRRPKIYQAKLNSNNGNLSTFCLDLGPFVLKRQKSLDKRASLAILKITLKAQKVVQFRNLPWDIYCSVSYVPRLINPSSTA